MPISFLWDDISQQKPASNYRLSELKENIGSSFTP